MRTIRKIAAIAVIVAIAFIPDSWLFHGEVIAIRVQAKVPLTTRQIIAEVFGEEAQNAIAVARCESGLNPMAVNYEDKKLNDHVSRGLFQLSEINGKLENWQNARVNTQKAFELYQKNGWRPWYLCSKRLGLL